MTGNPMVALNRAVAAAMVHGPAAGLALLEALDEPLAGHYRLDAVRAHCSRWPATPARPWRTTGPRRRRTTSVPERTT